MNVKFVAPLGEIPREFQPAASKEPEENATNKPATNEVTTELSDKSAAKAVENQLNAKDLALTNTQAALINSIIGFAAYLQKSPMPSGDS